MLKEIAIKNFQSHKGTNLQLSDKLTAITGSSDSGKSSIVRAIKWLVTNRPTGTAFQSHFIKPKESTKVSLQFDKTIASRIRSKSKNSYELGSEKFNVVRTDVPEEVSQFVNLDPEINIQGQHDRYFLLQDSAGEVAKKLNKVADLEIIDFVLKEVDSKIRKNTQDIKSTETDIEEVKEELKQYEHLDEVENLTALLTSQVDELNQVKTNSQTLETTTQTIQETREDIKQIDEWLKIEDESEQLFELIDKYSTLTLKINNLESLTDEIEDLQNEIKSIEKFLNIEEDLNELEDLTSRYINTTLDFDKFQNLLKSIKEYQESIEYLSEEINNMTDDAVKILKEYKICPFCGREINEDQIEKHIESWL